MFFAIEASAYELAGLPCGIIFEGEKNALVGAVAGELYKIGLFRDRDSEIFTPELLMSLNEYRAANSLPALPYCDPVTLRMLTGIECGGDEILLLARYAQSVLPDGTEVERFDICRNAIKSSRELGISIGQYISGKVSTGALFELPVPAETLKSAVLAQLMES